MNDSKINYDKSIFTKAKIVIASKKEINKASRKKRIKQLRTQRKIVDFLKFNFVAKRKDIVKALNIPRTTIYDNLLILKKLKIVDCLNLKFDKTKGRSFTIWYLTSEMKQITDLLVKAKINHNRSSKEC